MATAILFIHETSRHVTYNHIWHALPFGIYTNLSLSDLVSIILYTKKEFSDNKERDVITIYNL